ncbi:hypothetical protein [Nocardia sp. NPDC047654]|uniref:hypothetical protein n=1 Tax=Nocardia sp. NPDC047654 TaxID=3364314 RepID=UPI0037139B42
MRKLWRRLSWVMPLLRPIGMAPRMTAEQMAQSNIEVGGIARERVLGPVMDNITVPTRYVSASGSSLGSKGDEQERIRASLHKVVERNPNIQIHAKVPSNHGNILRKDFRAIAEAVRAVAGPDREHPDDKTHPHYHQPRGCGRGTVKIVTRTHPVDELVGGSVG